MIERSGRSSLKRRQIRGLSSIKLLCLILLSGILVSCASTPPETVKYPAGSSVQTRERGTVAILGATGMVGRYLVREALSRGYSVRALARTPAKLEAFADQITIVEGNALEPAIIAKLLEGSDVVVSAIGPVRSDGSAATSVSTEVSRNIVRYLEGNENSAVSRYIVISGAAVVMPGDDRDLMGWLVRTLAQLGLRDALTDKQREYEILAASALDWTLVRCPVIEEEPFQREPLVSLKTPPAFRVRAGELAHLVFDALDSGAYITQGPFPGSQ